MQIPSKKELKNKIFELMDAQNTMYVFETFKMRLLSVLKI